MRADRYSAGLLGGIGLAILTVGLVLLATVGTHPAAFDIAWRMAVCGLGFGPAPVAQQSSDALFGAASPQRRRERLLGTARLTGQTLGAALGVLIFGVAPKNGATIALAVAAVFAAAAVVSMLRLTGKRSIEPA